MARLKVRRHQQDFGELVLDESKKHFLGRKEGSDVVLHADPGISRQHMELYYDGGVWIAKILSQHLPIVHEGKTLIQLELKATTTFQVQPYEFIFENEDSVVEKADFENFNEMPLVVDRDITPEDSMSVGSESSESEFNQAIPVREDFNNDEASSDAINPEVSFHGSEEKTSEISLTGEPYLKFMYSTHSESIRLKGNKWIAGRDNIAQIHLDDRKASRQHFSIEKAGEQFYIKDLKSANGTLLNGQELASGEAKDLKSGDIITVNQLTIIFELRDLSFSDKLKDLPLQAYSGPMILTSQEWDSVGPNLAPALPQPMPLSTPQLAQLPGTVYRIDPPKKKNNLRMILMVAVAVIVVAGAVTMKEEPKPQATNDDQIKTFESLKPEEQKLVIDDYNLVQQYAAAGQIENALNRLEKIHTLVPFYKDSKEIEARMREAREIVKQQEFIKQQQREQEETKARVIAIVQDCRDRYASGVDADAAKTCLAEALQLDPDNIDAQSIVAGIEMRLAQAREQERQLKEYNDSVDKGRELYGKAKTLLQNKDYFEAINAFSAHMNSNLPDPDNLKNSSERTIASIQNHINAQKGRIMDRARALQSSGNLRDAILHAEQAKKVDPYDYSIPNFIEFNRRELESQMKMLYQDGAIEEKFGNLDKSKDRWKKIIDTDVPTGEYYLKAKRKMQQYGLL